MTGIQYLNFIADIFGVDADERLKDIRKYADRFELTQDLAQPIGKTFPWNEAEACHYCSVRHHPRLIIMDEPFVGLDPKAAHLLKEMMHQVCDGGSAIFFSTHVLEVAEKLCDKVAIIKGGQLIRSGTMEEVKGDDSLEDVFLELEEEKMLKVLVKKQLMEIFRSYFYNAKKNKAYSKSATARVCCIGLLC